MDITFADAALSSVAAVRPAIDHLATLSNMGPRWAWWCSGSPDCDNGGSFLLTKGAFSARYFPVPGTYEYHSTRMGLSGRVTVVDEQ